MKCKKIICLILVIFMLTGCGVKQIESKTSYGINETAILDHFEIICNDYNIEEYSDTEKKLTISFDIKNNKNGSVNVSSNDFRIYNNSNYVYSNDSFSYNINSNENKEVNISFIIPEQDIYKILFYSNVVSNNVAFELSDK